MLNRFGNYLFSAAVALNMFQSTGLLILLGVFGASELAAEVGIVQGAAVAVFMAFSANARNLILGDKGKQNFIHLLHLRLMLLLPLALAACMLVVNVVEVPLWLVLVLIARRAFEWLAELQICHWEAMSDKLSVFRFLILQGMGVMPLVVLFVLHDPVLFKLVLIVWAIMPAMSLYKLRGNVMWQREAFRLHEFLPHMGSSGVIAASVYLFRMIILLQAGKAMAGVLFSAFALGSMISSLYTIAIGPSHIAAGGGERPVKMVSRLLTVAGIFWVIAALSIDMADSLRLLHAALGFSLIGGGLMILAQHLRMRILQVEKGDVFVQDCLANVLLISSIPFAVTVFGIGALLLMFVWSALLNLMYYMLPVGGSRVVRA